MSRAQATRQQIETVGVVAVLRGDFASRIIEVGEALVDGGITSVEVTLNSPNALASIKVLCGALRDQALIGAGTVMGADEVEAAFAHGAQFIVAPDTNPAVVAACRERDCAVIPGALTPTEVAAAWRLGATLIKIFPASVLGPAYLRALRGPLANVPLLPTGGVALDNVASFIEAGAVAVGVGGPLLGRLPSDDLTGLSSRAAAFVARVATARKSMGARGNV